MATPSASGAGVSATFVGRLSAANALGELARADAAARGTLCDVGTAVAAAAAATATATATAAKTGSQRRRNPSGRQAPLASAGRCGSAGGDKTLAGNTTARELIMSAVADRAGSGWAWERELAFLLMDACCARGDEREGKRGGSSSGSGSGVVHVGLR